MAITAWSAKVSSSLICCRGEGTYIHATCDQCSNEFALADEAGTPNQVRQSLTEPSVGIIFCSRRSGICSVPCSRIQRNRGSSILISTRLQDPGIGPK